MTQQLSVEKKRCAECGSEKTYYNKHTGWLQWRHHPNPKTRRFGIWFCQSCHGKLFRRYKEQERKKTTTRLRK